MTFDVLVLDLRVDLPEPRGSLGNFFRGQLGAALRRFCTCCDPDQCPRICDYGRIFDPPRDFNAPSGLLDPPRPFVIRASEPGKFTLNLFDLKGNAAARVVEALRPSSFSIREIRCDLRPVPVTQNNLEIRFLTPTDLRTKTPDFGTLFARARDRVSTLRSAYGPGSLDVDFQGLGRDALQVNMTGRDLQSHSIKRRSANSGETHTLSGFTGWATYQGDFSNFLPILRSAQYTGIGRKTVWGNGQISLRLF